ncbi:MAG TPA: hypothetical protein VGY99_20740 [Candidatus Binataceae bacterium]|jgi:hypothetical protein|nr:hypothetical protein [Candidatus Binataceae bacterium]
MSQGATRPHYESGTVRTAMFEYRAGQFELGHFRDTCPPYDSGQTAHSSTKVLSGIDGAQAGFRYSPDLAARPPAYLGECIGDLLAAAV